MAIALLIFGVTFAAICAGLIVRAVRQPMQWEQWRTPEDISYAEYSGMSVNERLANSGLVGEYDQAARSRDATKMMTILRRVALSEVDAKRVVDSVLAKRRD